MRLIDKSRRERRGKAPRIAISQAEITADLNYPVGRDDARQRQSRAGEAGRGGGR